MPRYTKPSVGWARSVDDLRAALRGIASKETQADILEAAVDAACQPILVAAKRLAFSSHDTGALRDSLTIKTVAYKNSGKAVGLVGPDRKYRVKGKVVGKLGTLFGAIKGSVRRPANYAHLVEYGHMIARGGRLKPKYARELVGTGRFTSKGKELKRWRRGAVVEPAKGTSAGFVQAKPFLRPAVFTTREAQSAAFEQAVSRGLDRELRKHNKAAGTRVRYKRAA
jgi:hypothetical protein